MATNATTRLQATAIKTSTKNVTKAKVKAATPRTRVHALELPKFRYVDDVTRFLDKMNEEVDELASMVHVQQKALAFLQSPKENVQAALLKAATFEFNVSPEAGEKRSHLKRKIDPDIPKIVVPNIDKLKNQYALSENLYEKHRLLESVETQLALQFPDRGGEGYQNAAGALKALKDKVGEKLKEVLGFLNEIAAKHVPRTFKRYMEAIALEVQEHVAFEDSKVFLYVSATPEGELAFTYYLMLIGATNDEGKVTPHLYISVQWVVGSSINVQVNHEYELPNQLLREGGTDVGSVGEAVKAISHLLDLEDFATSMGTVPLATQLRMDPSTINQTMFTFKDIISKIDIDSEKLVFKLRPGLEKEQIKEIGYALYPEVKELFKGSRKTKLRMSSTSKQIEFQVINVAERGAVHFQDAEFLQQRFGLNDSQLRKVVELLNNGERP